MLGSQQAGRLAAQKHDSGLLCSGTDAGVGRLQCTQLLQVAGSDQHQKVQAGWSNSKSMQGTRELTNATGFSPITCLPFAAAFLTHCGLGPAARHADLSQIYILCHLSWLFKLKECSKQAVSYRTSILQRICMRTSRACVMQYMQMNAGPRYLAEECRLHGHLDP